MSEENIEIVRRVLELWSEGDLDTWANYFDADVVVEAPAGWPEGAVSHGLEAWRQQAQRLRDTWEEARAELDDIRSIGDSRVISRIRYVTRGKGTGMSFDRPLAVAFTLSGGKITRASYFWDMEALEAAGLSD